MFYQLYWKDENEEKEVQIFNSDTSPIGEYFLNQSFGHKLHTSGILQICVEMFQSKLEVKLKLIEKIRKHFDWNRLQ